MNILIPDSWLREFLKTKASPKDIQRCLSLCGPSVERVRRLSLNKDSLHDDYIYDIEITTNRPDAMSVVGVAREAAAILPRFGIPAKLVGDPYTVPTKPFVAAHKKEGVKKLLVTSDARLNPRFTAIIFDHVKIKPSPIWMQHQLEATGIRAINNVVDITNYIMRVYGQPVHAFDFNQINPEENSATMIVRGSKKGEKVVTLDGKVHLLADDDIVMEDSTGRLIDLCGIMGGGNSHINDHTTSVILFMQTYDAAHIRRTSMRLAQRSEAAALFEKSLDPELVLAAFTKGVTLMENLTDGSIVSKLYDIYPKPYKPYTVSITKEKATAYISSHLSDSEIKKILTPLGFKPTLSKKDITITVPSFRTDVALDVDIIEEIARIYGYHNIKTKLPEGEPPVVIPNPELSWEHEIKVRLRDWGFTELYTYSMISEKLMTIFGLDTKKAYKISNPLSEEWVYMRPSLLPSILLAVEQNLHFKTDLQLFELSMMYQWREHDLPKETPTLIVVWTGNKYREAKGLGEKISSLFGLSNKGTVEEIQSGLLSKMGIHIPVTVLTIDFADLVTHANPVKKYKPVSKYPPIIEDLSFVVPEGFQVGPLIDVLSHVHKLIESITFLDAYENKRTFRVTYNDPTKNLTSLDVAPIRQKLIEYAGEKFGATVVTA